MFVRDRATGKTERVSVSSDGKQVGGPSSEPSISADGRYVAFSSYARTWSPTTRTPAQPPVKGRSLRAGTCSCATGRPKRPSG